MDADEYEEIEDGATGITDYDRGYVDDWLKLCDRCSLDDCIRAEGEWSVFSKYRSKRLAPCAVFAARKAGLTVKQALRNYDQFNLLPPP